MALIQKIVSGGQTGADRAALDFAIKHHIPHGGWCPCGRRAEGGKIPRCYDLVETPHVGYGQRTEWNVRDSDGTVVFSIGGELIGGSQEAVFMALKLRKPLLRIWRDGNFASPEQALLRFIQENNIKVLNVAGPRANTEPEVYGFVKDVLGKALDLLQEPAVGEPVGIALGNSETMINELIAAVVQQTYPGINFKFEAVSRAGDFIRLATRRETRLAMFLLPGNVEPDPGSPPATPKEQGVGIIKAIKSKHRIPIIAMTSQPDCSQTLLDAGADMFLALPFLPQEIVDAVARCLGLEPKKLVPS